MICRRLDRGNEEEEEEEEEEGTSLSPESGKRALHCHLASWEAAGKKQGLVCPSIRNKNSGYAMDAYR